MRFRRFIAGSGEALADGNDAAVGGRERQGHERNAAGKSQALHFGLLFLSSRSLRLYRRGFTSESTNLQVAVDCRSATAV
ncbi:MAG: hypothetical protein Q8K85_10265, partial [Hyphomicrobium sp.]|nr:hypothetical protein [Hyphomicrobium sp.]